MATFTPNIGLTLPIGTEHVSRSVFNQNMTKIDTAIGAIPSGHDLYGDLTSVAADLGDPSSASSVTGADAFSKINSLNSNMKNRVFTLVDATVLASGTNINTVTGIGCYSISSNELASTMTNLPITIAGTLYVKGAMNIVSGYIQQVFIPYNATAIYVRMSNNYGSTWFAWCIIGQEDGTWSISIPRATFNTLANNRWHRQGNIVYCETCIEITASQAGNAYIENNCIPKFGLTLGNVFGTWHDYNVDKSGTIAGYNGGNIWMALNGDSGPAPLTNFVGHNMGISLTAMLH